MAEKQASIEDWPYYPGLITVFRRKLALGITFPWLWDHSGREERLRGKDTGLPANLIFDPEVVLF